MYVEIGVVARLVGPVDRLDGRADVELIGHRRPGQLELPKYKKILVTLTLLQIWLYYNRNEIMKQ